MRPVIAGFLALSLLAATTLPGSDAGAQSLTIDVTSGGRPIEGASVRAGSQQQATDPGGRASLTLEPGEYELHVEAAGYLPASTRATVLPEESRGVSIELQALEEQVTVTAARSSTRLEEQPLRVEVIDRDDIEEKALMTPGSVAMLLGETTGLRVQTTAPSLGAANVRIQGLRGHYSQLLADGLPLYGAQGDSFSLLQVPPLDLGQVEVIKGVASALYGPSALGGVVNLVSRRPRAAEEEVLFNATTLGGVDATGWLARPGQWSWSTLGGYHGQGRRDVDGDGWTSVAGYDRGLVRPRLFYDDDRGTSILATAGAMSEDRKGGTTTDAVAPDGSPFPESLRTRHVDAAGLARWVAGSRLISVRASVMRTSRDRVFGDDREHGTQLTWFGEGSITGTSGRHTWVAGAAFQQDRYDSRELPQFDYVFSAPAAFAQDEARIASWLTLAASVRADAHSEYGTLVSPRFSAMARPGARWTLRASAGLGAFAPTPFNEETDETGLARLQPLSGLEAERGRGASVDATFHQGPWEVSGTVFGSVVQHATQLETVGPAAVALVNATEPTRTYGTELVARYRVEGFTLMLTHAWTRSSELDMDSGQRREVPLTPRHFASLNAIVEGGRHGSFGVEAYYTGAQDLDADPYLSSGRPYFLIGALAQRRFGKLLLFVNAENLLDVRQTREEPMVLPRRRPDGRWLVDAWAPLDGRVLNGGVRLTF